MYRAIIDVLGLDDDARLLIFVFSRPCIRRSDYFSRFSDLWYRKKADTIPVPILTCNAGPEHDCIDLAINILCIFNVSPASLVLCFNAQVCSRTMARTRHTQAAG